MGRQVTGVKVSELLERGNEIEMLEYNWENKQNKSF